jgi:hypothetical protein
MRSVCYATTLVCLGIIVPPAVAAPLAPPLSGLAFQLGTWSGAGKVTDTGGSSTGNSVFSAEANGTVMLRKDHTNLFGKDGKPAGGFDQLMVIYQEGTAIHADYFDGAHIIHYGSAQVDPGRSVVFTTTTSPSSPAFRLSYALGESALKVGFAMAPPGGQTYRQVAAGTLRK